MSEKFLNKALEVASLNDGDSSELLDAHSRGGVPRWKADNTEKLRIYLDENGYLDPAQELDRSDIRIRVQSAAGTGYAMDSAFGEWLQSMINGLPGLEPADRIHE